MSCRISVAGGTCDPSRCEGLVRIVVARIRQRCCHPRCMTMETPWIDGESQRHLPRSQKVGRHVPHLFLGVPVDGCLEPITLLLEEVGPAPSSRTQKVAQLPASFQCTPWIIALVVEPHVAAFSRSEERR